MKTTTIRVDESLMELTGEVARHKGTTVASLIRDELVRAVDERTKIDPVYAAFVIEVAQSRHAAVTREVEATLGACAAAHFTGPLPHSPKPTELGT